MCKAADDYREESRHIDEHVVKALDYFERMVKDVSGEELTAEQVVDELAKVMVSDLKEIAQKFARFRNNECVECGAKMPALAAPVRCTNASVICETCDQSG